MHRIVMTICHETIRPITILHEAEMSLFPGRKLNYGDNRNSSGFDGIFSLPNASRTGLESNIFCSIRLPRPGDFAGLQIEKIDGTLSVKRCYVLKEKLLINGHKKSVIFFPRFQIHKLIFSQINNFIFYLLMPLKQQFL